MMIQHMDFCHNFCFTLKLKMFMTWIVKLIFGNRQLMIWHQNWSFSLLSLPWLISFDAKSSIVSCEISLSRHMKWTLDVSKRNKNCGKNPLWMSDFYYLKAWCGISIQSGNMRTCMRMAGFIFHVIFSQYTCSSDHHHPFQVSRRL